jgi:hypothetical protein
VGNETVGGSVEVNALCTSLEAALGKKNAVCLQEMVRVYGFWTLRKVIAKMFQIFLLMSVDLPC